ncbi:hypothetical protein [Streptomyces sp. NPDC012825]|uniref:hypothetical protein n=1 Tax=Streptomyces sp. NPDC012825 TaxID=3364851 RepID=UPI0036B71093
MREPASGAGTESGAGVVPDSGAGTESGAGVVPDPETGPEPEAGAEPDAEAAPAPRTHPRLGTVPLSGPSRTGAARRRGEVPSVRAVRLADGPPAPAGRAAAPAAVTPVPLPVPRPADRAVPTENRPEEPQP